MSHHRVGHLMPHGSYHVLWGFLCLSLRGDREDTLTMIRGSTFGDYSLGLYGLGWASIPKYFKGMIALAFLMALSQDGSVASSTIWVCTSPGLGLTKAVCFEHSAYWKHGHQVSGSKRKNHLYFDQ